MDQNPHAFYSSKREELSLEKKKLQKRSGSLSVARFVFFVLLLSGIYVEYVAKSSTGSYMMLGGFLLLLISIRIHSKVRERIGFIQSMLKASDVDLKQLTYSFSTTYPEGQGNKNHFYAYDLDIVGNKSLFHFINRCRTQFGVDKMLSSFLDYDTGRDRIKEKQEFVEELSKYPTKRLELLASFLQIENPSFQLSSLKGYAQELEWIKNPLIRVSPLLTLIYSITCIVLFSVSIISSNHLLLMLAVPITFVSFFFKRFSKWALVANEFHKNLSAYKSILNKTLAIEIHSKQGKLLQSQLIESHASDGIKQLEDISQFINARANIMVWFLFNSLFAYDIWCFSRFYRWLFKYENHMSQWQNALATIEVYLSKSAFRFNFPEYTLPEIQNFEDRKKDTVFIEAIELGHPLLPQEKCVRNSFVLDNQQHFAIITGANMAGKSTFLRSLGVNLVLAQMGLPVVAEKFAYCAIPLLSSMRTTDSLSEGQSYFQAELSKLKIVVSQAKKGPIFILLDEILKGTNSKDKAEGSKAFLKKLLHLNAYGVIATHDVSLCSLEEEYPEKILNQKFEVELGQNDLHFDYKLQKGICQTLNAKFLMEKLEIID